MSENSPDHSFNMSPVTDPPPKRWYEKPIKKRKMLKGAVVAVAALALGEGLVKRFGIPDVIGFIRGEPDTLDYFSQIPELRQNSASVEVTTYFELDHINSKDATTGEIVEGDSIAWGLVESDILQASDGKVTATPHSATSYFNQQMYALGFPARGEGARPDPPALVNWAEDNQAVVGSTLAQTLETWDNFFKSMESYKGDRIPFSLVFSVGGDDLLNLLQSHEGEIAAAYVINDAALPLLRRDFQAFLYGDKSKGKIGFIENYTNFLVKVMFSSGSNYYLSTLERIFIFGIPDGGQIRNVNFEPWQKDSSVYPMTDNQRQVGAILTVHMNNAILDAIDAAKKIMTEQHPEMQIPKILFQDLKGIELGGIHPTVRGYKEIAKRLLRRCFMPDGIRSFWDEATERDRVIPDLQET